MLSDYQNLSTANLMDLLAEKTARLTQLLSAQSFGTEYQECKEAIHQLQSEIESRKQSTTTNEGIQFQEPDTTLS